MGTAKRKIYENPPLVEAVFEFFYITDSWSPIIPGVFYNEIKSRFPIISQNKGGFGIAIDGGGLKIGSGNSEITQFKNKQNDTIIQLTDNLLTVNKLPKYSGWESFLEIINFAIETLQKVVTVQKVNRIGIKMLNKIDVETHSLENFKKYFTIYPVLGHAEFNNVRTIQLNLEEAIVENEEVISIILSTLRKEQNLKAPVLFQIYVTKVNNIDSNYSEWLENTHRRLTETFENSLTDYCKSEFDHV
jgi:uncharacterized protein (TIGR04255 family)